MTTAPYAEEPGLPDNSPDGADQEEGTEAPPAGGLVQLGSPDGVVCEDGVCWVPPAKE